MLLKYIYDRYLAQASYLVGCATTGEALVIDPARDITPYLLAARQEGLRITQVADTHIHADYISGARELAAATGARLYLSAMGDEQWQYAYPDANIARLQDGDSWNVGRIGIQAIHTPGHTPEHLIYQLTDTAAADRSMGLFTGDCLFVGNIGRPDLLDAVAGFTGTKEIGARGQFRNMQLLRTLPDYLQIWPGHGAGSACGKGLGAIPSSTLGYEKLFNPAFQIDDEDAFVEWLLEGQPEAPRYFAQMKTVNKLGPALLNTLPDPARLPANVLTDALAAGHLVIDTRPGDAFARQHIPGTVHIPASEQSFSTYAGWYVRYDEPTHLIADEADLPRILMLLRAIGVDHIGGVFPPEVVAGGQGRVEQVTPGQAAALLGEGAFLLDVRGADEYRSTHIAGAVHIPMGAVPERISELPTAVPLVVQCGGGVRSQVVASLLQRAGLRGIHNLAGGIDAWIRDGLPVEQG
ncbi:MAG: MBL fold metallo-hydrolase [Anaerolineae bacterium]|nr:MBL fold metallo-hydrolase [Anaerolineae bacterium]